MEYIVDNVLLKLSLCSNSPDVVRVSGKFDLLDRILPKLKRKNHRYMSFVVFFYQGVNIQYTHGMIYMLWLFPAKKQNKAANMPYLKLFPFINCTFLPSAKYQTALMLDLYDVQLYFMSKTQFTLKLQI